ncbi:Per1-like protein [Wallemia mellicola CBS 633.66]|uniref:Post-GPI attachment to proteins factor 3 n=1 Tax=Wallemia mellicola (strain ATCC MYA-4683 / CBS 633.66) TaxID=671144 RepID=I4Y660_WALMC|nr:Per1-like protein [Wallemia mellicola CBS 633.66]EIM19452.1 Per1-like protein [Wallemia mellicola CBS 633.66]|eukprot:XP_006960484.1 Per1-like protein [Wallemia mellicola CBS 633.66]
MLLFLLGLISTALASIGDRQPKFIACVRNCLDSSKYTTNMSLWSELDECRYQCMHQIVDQTKQNWVKEPIHQYYGKWPFYRFMGIQEPFSTLFSLLNLLAHRYGLRDINHRLGSHPNKRSYLLLSYINILAWVASTIFHIRDTTYTERLDYIFAGAAVFSGLNLACTRVFNFSFKKSATALFGIYILHIISLLSKSRIDYSWNMAIIVAAGMIHNIIWIYFSIKLYLESQHHSHPAPFTPILLVLLTTLALSLELTEFEPLFRSIDAHSLWHASTFPLAIHWYSWLIQDADWQRQSKTSAFDKQLDA